MTANTPCASAMTIGQRTKTGLSIDPFDGGQFIQIGISFCGAKSAVLTGIPKRQARAIANRILQELDYAEGRRARRPSTPHIFYDDHVLITPEYLDRIGVGS